MITVFDDGNRYVCAQYTFTKVHIQTVLVYLSIHNGDFEFGVLANAEHHVVTQMHDLMLVVTHYVCWFKQRPLRIQLNGILHVCVGSHFPLIEGEHNNN